MGVQKQDYSQLKKEFLASNYSEVKRFLCDKGVTYNARTRMETKGWSKEKKELKAIATEKAIKQVGNKLAKQLEPSTEFLLGNIAKAIELTKVKLDQMEQKGNINVKDLNTIRGMNRIQNGQPTTYVKEESDVNQNIRIEGIHILMGPNNIDNESQTSQKQTKSNE